MLTLLSFNKIFRVIWGHLKIIGRDLIFLKLSDIFFVYFLFILHRKIIKKKQIQHIGVKILE